MGLIVNVNCKHISRYSYACNKRKRILGIFKRTCVETDFFKNCAIADRILTEENRPSFRLKNKELDNRKEIMGGYELK